MTFGYVRLPEKKRSPRKQKVCYKGTGRPRMGGNHQKVSNVPLGGDFCGKTG